MRRLNNDMVAHIWAQQNQPYGQNANDSFSFSGRELISYNTTIALHYGSFILISNDSMSATTGKHLSLGRHAASCQVIEIDDIFSWGMRYNCRNSEPKGIDIKKALLAMILETAQSYDKRRADSTRERDTRQIEKYIEHLSVVCEHFGLKFPKGYETAQEALGQTAATVARLEKAAKAKEAKHKKEQAALRKAQEYNFNQWLNGDDLPSGRDGERRLVTCPYIFRAAPEAFLTVYGETVYTSQGAEAPLEHVKKAFKLYRRIIKSGKAWTKNGERARLGHFELDEIDSKGNARAGCHTFTAQELARFAKKWSI